MTAQEKLTWDGIKKLTVAGAVGIYLYNLHQKADVWFPRMMESPAALVACFFLAAWVGYMHIQDQMIKKAEKRADELYMAVRQENKELREQIDELQEQLKQCQELCIRLQERRAV